jgi:hypothetical protein
MLLLTALTAWYKASPSLCSNLEWSPIALCQEALQFLRGLENDSGPQKSNSTSI